MKIATWNVNSLRVRLPHVLDWLATHQPDVLALQETKVPDENFPLSDIEQLGYKAVFSGQKSYNGVALLSRIEGQDIVKDCPGVDDHQRRLIMSTFGGVRVIDVYVPNGESVLSEKFEYKLHWLGKLHALIKEELAMYPLLVVLGDFNIAPEDQDVHDPAVWHGKIMCSEPERAAYQRLLAMGLRDTFRLFDQPPGIYSWWDYRMAQFRRNMGLRIDLILASPALCALCKQCTVDKAPRKLERPSDHAPVVAEFDLPMP